MSADSPQFVEIFTAPADQPEVARKLLEAAGDDQEAVRTTSDGFRVPAAIAVAAGFGPGDEDVAEEPADDEPDTPADGPVTPVATETPAGAPEAPAAPVAPDGPVTPAATPEAPSDDEPKGAALDAALREAGLSTEGKADEKRARLAAHRAK